MTAYENLVQWIRNNERVREVCVSEEMWALLRDDLKPHIMVTDFDKASVWGCVITAGPTRAGTVWWTEDSGTQPEQVIFGEMQ